MFISIFTLHSGRFLSYSRKRKISQNDHSLSFIVIWCYSLSFVVTRCHSLSLVITGCHSMSLVVPLVFIRCHSLSRILPLVVTCCHWINHSFVFYKRLIYRTIFSKYDGSKSHASLFIAEYSECSTSETKG